MTYKKLFYLKYVKRCSTYDLVRKYPDEIERVSEVALMEVPEETLRKIITEEKALNRLMRLKRQYLKFVSLSKAA